MLHPVGMTRVGQRCILAVAAALVPSMLALPSQAAAEETTAAPTPSAEATTEPAEQSDQTDPTPAPTPAPEPAPTTEPAPPPAPRQSATARTAPAPAAKAPAKVALKKLPSRWVSIRINSGANTQVFTREKFWLRGRVYTTKGKPQAGVKVRIYRDTTKGRTRVATVRTKANGSYAWSPAKSRAGTYRAVVSKARYSAKVTVKIRTGKRTLASREKAMSFLLGSKRGGIKRAKGLTWQEYSKGYLIQRGGRTWLVRLQVVGQVRAHGGPAGALGAPTGDITCGLPEGGCLQQFRTGAVYVNKKAKKKVTSAVGPRLGAADLVAVAKSQVGYREKSPRKSKYNKWIGRTGPRDPWCGFFVSWLAHAAGKPNAVIKAKSFPALHKAEKKRGRTTKTARVGRLAYIGYFSKGSATHVGIVSKVEGDHVWVIEGNVSAGGGMQHPRGVHLVKRHKSNVVFYADPRY